MTRPFPHLAITKHSWGHHSLVVAYKVVRDDRFWLKTWYRKALLNIGKNQIPTTLTKAKLFTWLSLGLPEYGNR